MFNHICTTISVELKEFKLSLNMEKLETHERPIITGITSAKSSISDLVENIFSNIKIVKIGDLHVIENHKVNSKKRIIQFKTIIKEKKIAYKDVQNYALTIVENNFFRLINNLEQLDNKLLVEKEQSIVDFIYESLEFCFFIYTVDPRVNTTIKICRISSVIIDFFKSHITQFDRKNAIFKIIYDNSCFVLGKYKTCEYTQIETLYLLSILKKLGKKYRLNPINLIHYIGFSENTDGTFTAPANINYFSIISILSYIENIKIYTLIKDALIISILNKFNTDDHFLRNSAELSFLALDTVSCPYVDMKIKRIILDKYNIKTNLERDLIIKQSKCWFSKWHDVNLTLELLAKKGQEVY